MKIELNVEKKYVLGLIVSFLVLAGVIGAIAYGTDEPEVFGHTASEIDFVISEYAETCSHGDGKYCDPDNDYVEETNMGEHKFCALSAVTGPGGFNTNCKVYRDGDDWILRIRDSDEEESHACRALCFD